MCEEMRRRLVILRAAIHRRETSSSLIRRGVGRAARDSS